MWGCPTAWCSDVKASSRSEVMDWLPLSWSSETNATGLFPMHTHSGSEDWLSIVMHLGVVVPSLLSSLV